MARKISISINILYLIIFFIVTKLFFSISNKSRFEDDGLPLLLTINTSFYLYTYITAIINNKKLKKAQIYQETRKLIFVFYSFILLYNVFYVHFSWIFIFGIIPYIIFLHYILGKKSIITHLAFLSCIFISLYFYIQVYGRMTPTTYQEMNYEQKEKN